jgi:chitodextrinase
MVGAAPTAAETNLRSRDAAAHGFVRSGATPANLFVRMVLRMQPRPSGGVRSFCALFAVLTVASWPAAAHARVDLGRAHTGPVASAATAPRLWGVEIGKHARPFLRRAYLRRMKQYGINALVVDPRRLTLRQLRATAKAARGANLWLIEVIPPAHGKATRSIKAVRATCRAAHQPAETLCAASVGSIATAIALSVSGPPDRMTAVRLAGPAQLEKLRGAASSGSRILALAKLRAHGFATSAWQEAIGVAAAMSSVDLAVAPTGASKHALNDYLHQLGKPPTAPGPLVETASTSSTISIAWAPATDRVGVTEYDITKNGTFAGKVTTTNFTVGGLGCAKNYQLAVTARNAAGRTSAASTLMASTAACPDVTPPTAPAGLTEVSSTQTSATVAWAASTDDVAVAGYGVFVDGSPVGTTVARGYTVTGLSCGSTHTVAVDAFDPSGNHSSRASISATTSACSDTTPPTASITAPANGATVSGSVSVTASASDNVAVARVEFWVDGVNKATDTSAPYSYSWNTTTFADGSHTILVKAFDTSNNSSSASITVTVSNGSACVTSSASWQNTAMLSPLGTFDVSFDATPSAGNVDAVTGLSAAPAGAYTDLAVIARFNSSGSIDAINGGGYAAADTVPYAGGSTYHFRAVVNVPSHTYSLYVTPPGKPETPVALNYAFRTGQGGVSALSNWAVTAAVGSHQTCGLAVTNPTDMTAPSTPTGLAKTNSTQTSLTFSWTASTDNVGVNGYTVYVNGAASSAAAGTSRTISGLACGTTYTIGVDAYDAAGNHSSQTSATMATSACPGDTTPPSTPTNLAQSGSTATSVTASWAASTDNVGVTGYTLYVNGAQVGTTTGTSATATGLSCGTTYTVAVDAFDAAGNHSTKASVSASTAACSGDTTPPSTPTGLATSGISANAATLSWTASTDNVGVTGYRLFQNGTQVGTSTATTYQFTSLSCGTTYTLGVAAVDAAGNVSGTATASAQTSACSGGGNFSGTFDCYGSTPNCTGLSPKSCSSTISSGLQTALNNASGGDVICLSSTSSYGNISLTKTYSSLVTVQPASGVNATIGNVSLNNVDKLRITGAGASSLSSTSLKVAKVDIDPNSGCSSDLSLDHLIMTPGGTYVYPKYSCSSGMNILFDHNRYDDLSAPGGGEEERFRVVDDGSGPSANDGVTLSNSHFSGGCSDGIDFAGDPWGTVIGPGNEFTNISQAYADANCSGSHVDPIQGLGSEHTFVTGNWFHDVGGSGGILSAQEPGLTVTNNVFANVGYPFSVLVKGAENNTYTHNVFYEGISWQTDGQVPAGSGDLVQNNVFAGDSCIAIVDGTSYTANHNLGSGTGCDVTGRPVFVASPSSGYYHYQLASTSPGYHAASDGKSLGIAP